MRKINAHTTLFLCFLFMAGQNLSFSDDVSPEKSQTNNQPPDKIPYAESPQAAANNENNAQNFIAQQNTVISDFSVGYSMPSTGEYTLTVTIPGSRQGIPDSPTTNPSLADTPPSSMNSGSVDGTKIDSGSLGSETNRFESPVSTGSSSLNTPSSDFNPSSMSPSRSAMRQTKMNSKLLTPAGLLEPSATSDLSNPFQSTSRTGPITNGSESLVSTGSSSLGTATASSFNPPSTDAPSNSFQSTNRTGPITNGSESPVSTGSSSLGTATASSFNPPSTDAPSNSFQSTNGSAPATTSRPDAGGRLSTSSQSTQYTNTNLTSASIETDQSGNNNNFVGFLQNFIPIASYSHVVNPVQINQDTIGESQTLTYKNTSSAENQGNLVLIVKSDYVFPRRIATTSYELNKKTGALTVTIKDSTGNRSETQVYWPKDGMKYIQQLLAMYKLAEKGQGPGRTKWESSKLADFIQSLESILKPLLSKIDPTEGKNLIDGRVPLTNEMINALISIAAQAGITLTKEEAIKALAPSSQENAALFSLIQKIIKKIDARISKNNSEPTESEIEDFIRTSARHNIKFTREEAVKELKTRKAAKKSTLTEDEINVLIKAAARLGITLTREQAAAQIASLSKTK